MQHGEAEHSSMAEKLIQGLSLCSNYILGHFTYNIGFNERCRNHCVTYGCSNPKDEKQRMMCLDFNDDKHAEEYDCKYCNVLPSLIFHLTRLVDSLQEKIEPDKFREMVYEIDQSHEAILAYKKQIMRNHVTVSTWDELFRKYSPELGLVTMDFAMKFLLRKSIEIQVAFK